MSPPALHTYFGVDADPEAGLCVPNVIVVDPRFDGYKPLVESARLGKLNLHIRPSAAEAIRLSRRLQVDAWLVAQDLDDMSGADFVELLRSRLGRGRMVIVGTAHPGSSEWTVAGGEAEAAGADSLTSPPITFADLERLLGRATADRDVLPADASSASRAFITLPVGVSAAVVAIAVLMLG